jgi:integrase/recombinase XerD
MKRWERESLTPEEIDLVIASARTDEEHAMMTTLADTGMRVNELLRLRRDWAHWRKGSHGEIRIAIKDDYTPVPGTKGRGPKTKRIRNVPMTSRLHDVLKAWFKDHNGFFRTYNHVYNVCVRSGEAAGLKKRVTPHIFRHSFVTGAWYKTDLKDAEIGQLVGHKDGRMVRDVYLHIDEKETARKIEESGWLER